MHMVIRTIVYASTKKEALSKAKEVFNGLCENQNPFDYFTTFDEENTKVSGKARWGNLPVVAKVSSKGGQKLVEEGMKYTYEGFCESLNSIRRNIVKFTNTQLFEGTEKDDMFRHRCHCIGKYRGGDIFLYDNDGEGIRSKRHLKDVLNKWNCLYEKQNKPNPYKNDDVWVIPADVHF